MFKLKKQMKRILYCAMAAALFVGTVGCADEKEGTDDPTVDNAVDRICTTSIRSRKRIRKRSK